jgi:glycosyltransferase involved in cell wall biosynthesis
VKALIVHYHLKPGGVSTVIRRHVRALQGEGIACSLLLGEAPPAPPEAPCAVIVEPSLAYDAPGAAPEGDEARAAAIVAAIARAAGELGPDTIVHVHNPTLRKNSSLLPALTRLAERGLPLFLHVHDLAEDWRPDAYSSRPYPPFCAWAAINGRDARRLKEAGASLVTLLPNPVFSQADMDAYDALSSGGSRSDMAGTAGAPASTYDTILYPVRGIRRKNLGEALLLSLFLPDGLRIGLTLPPSSAKDMPYYEGWRGLAAFLKAPFDFELGLAASLDDNYARAAAVLTSSVKEGFGLSFLEPLARSKVRAEALPVLGRRIDYVCADFEERGLAFPALYGAISVPGGLYDEAAMAERAQAAGLRCREAYGLAATASSLDGELAALFAPGTDFGRLDEVAQTQVILAIAGRPSCRDDMLAANPFLERWRRAEGPAAEAAVRRPSAELLSQWSEASYGSALRAAYEGLLEAREGGAALDPPDKAALLDLYLMGNSFYAVGL